MKNNKYVIIVIMLLTLPFLAMQTAAHSPQELVLVFDIDAQNLDVTITHVVDDPNSHYVNKVEIEKNDVLYHTAFYTSQPTTNTFSYNYTVEAVVGDVLTVTAFCNIAGSIERSITLTGDNTPPDAPTITGQKEGKIGTEYEYTFKAADADGDDVRYHINWGDGEHEWTNYYIENTDVKVKHSYDDEDTYMITAYAQDINGANGYSSTYDVTMPKNKHHIFNFPLFNWLFERFTNAFPILRHMFRA